MGNVGPAGVTPGGRRMVRWCGRRCRSGKMAHQHLTAICLYKPPFSLPQSRVCFPCFLIWFHTASYWPFSDWAGEGGRRRASKSAVRQRGEGGQTDGQGTGDGCEGYQLQEAPANRGPRGTDGQSGASGLGGQTPDGQSGASGSGGRRLKSEE